MSTEYLKIGEALIGEEQVMEMAAYINHLEAENKKIMEELKASKAYLSATLQQRNSANQKLQALLYERNNIIDIKEAKRETIVLNTELINPEQWAVPEGRVITTPKSNKL